MKPESIIAVIVCYNPDIDRLLDNLRSVSKQVNEVLIVDNNSKNVSSYYNEVKHIIENIEICRNSSNQGIAKALNLALEFCSAKGYKWLLTLDQDSICEDNMVSKMFEGVENECVALIAPRLKFDNIFIGEPDEKKGLNTLTHITSGSIINIEIVRMVGGFIEKLFIDYVDHELCLRLLINNYQLKYVPDAILIHELGNMTKHKFFNRQVIATNHLPFRRYYIFRNKIFVYKKYFPKFSKWVILDVIDSFKTIIKIVLYENMKYAKLKYIMKGIFDGVFNIYEKNINE